jgi:GNAT superfamily N-acetyltransferase
VAAGDILVLRDGTRIKIRPLEPSDREALARGFARLSPASRRLRFFTTIEALSASQLDYLTNVDHENHDAVAAVLVDERGEEGEGVGVGRWIRLSDEPTKAEIAVTVLDEYQGRGVGTLLLGKLAERAMERGVETLFARVLWTNVGWLDSLRSVGARIEPDEPGVARIEFDLALPEPPPTSVVRRVLREVATMVAHIRSP